MGKILLRRNSTAAAQPNASQIEPGELALNTADGRLFTELSNGTVVNLPVKSIEGQEISPSAVTTTGSVGVGLSSPAARLSVKGGGATSATEAVRVTNSNDATLFDVKNDGQASIYGPSAASTLSLKRLAGTGALEIGRCSFYNTFAPIGFEFGQQAAVVGGTDSGANTGAIWFETKNAGGQMQRLMTLKTSGIGIGMDAPASRLVIKGSSTTSATSALNVTNSSDGSLLFVRNDGNVGIGADTPSYKLSVNGDIAIVTADAGLRFTNTWGFDRITFRDDVPNKITADASGNYNWLVNNKNWCLSDVASACIGTTTGGARLVVVGTGSTSATSALNVLNSNVQSMLFVRNDGNVGVGTTTPAQKLSVEGVIGAIRSNIGVNNVLESSATFGSVIAGTRAKASMYGEVAHAAGGFSNVEGTAQHRVLVARGITLSGAFTVSIASPAVFTRTGHSLSVGDTVKLATTGALPTGLNTTTTYYVISAGLTGNEFRLSTTRDGAAINTSGTQSGTHTLIPTTSLTLNGATGNTAPALMVIPEKSTWSYTIKISAYSAQNNQGAAYHVFGGLRRNLSTTIELETSQGFTYLENSFNTTPALVSVDADAITNSLDIRVTGIANQSVRWAAVIDLVQVSFGTP